jgi:hypothetical protein
MPHMLQRSVRSHRPDGLSAGAQAFGKPPFPHTCMPVLTPPCADRIGRTWPLHLRRTPRRPGLALAPSAARAPLTRPSRSGADCSQFRLCIPFPDRGCCAMRAFGSPDQCGFVLIRSHPTSTTYFVSQALHWHCITPTHSHWHSCRTVSSI